MEFKLSIFKKKKRIGLERKKEKKRSQLWVFIYYIEEIGIWKWIIVAHTLISDFPKPFSPVELQVFYFARELNWGQYNSSLLKKKRGRFIIQWECIIRWVIYSYITLFYSHGLFPLLLISCIIIIISTLHRAVISFS